MQKHTGRGERQAPKDQRAPLGRKGAAASSRRWGRRRSTISVRPGVVAVRSAFGYLVLAGLYILLSSTLAEKFSGSLEQLGKFEIIKGFAFVVLTAAFFGVLLYVLLSRVQRIERVAIRQRDALAQSEKVAAAGVIAASVAQEMSDIIEDTQPELETLRESFRAQRLSHEQFNRSVGAIENALYKMNWTAERLARSSEIGSLACHSTIALRDLATELIRQARQNPRTKHCSLSVAIHPDIQVEGIEPLLKQLLMQLIYYAVNDTNGEGMIEIRSQPDGNWTTLEVHDDATPLSESEREIFSARDLPLDPTSFHLSLFTVRLAVRAHGGEVSVKESDLGGNCFIVRLPADKTSQVHHRKLNSLYNEGVRDEHELKH